MNKYEYEHLGGCASNPLSRGGSCSETKKL